MNKTVEIIKANPERARKQKRDGRETLRVAPYCRVSTDDTDQINSFKSQVSYYTNMVMSNPEWELVDIYADEAISGTLTKKRVDFQRLISDCMSGKVDMVLTKSISRFARNTLDTLNYVRKLKDKGIAVMFEEEHINTLTMDGELLLVILSSVAQQEVENISAHTKRGLQMKMQRGEIISFSGCLGYDYDVELKTIEVNEEEADIVRYIFKRYLEGAGTSIIASELQNLGHKTKWGNSKWSGSGVLAILKNEKYCGDLLQGKTFIVDPIQKKSARNLGEQDRFYIKDNHEAIISRDDFEKVQSIVAKRSPNKNGAPTKYSLKHAFSSKLVCGFCGRILTRRHWHSNSKYEQILWSCKGKSCKECPCQKSKAVYESDIEKAFVESYRHFCEDYKEAINDIRERLEVSYQKSNSESQVKRVNKQILSLSKKRKRLMDLYLEGGVSRKVYDEEYNELTSSIEKLQEKLSALQSNLTNAEEAVSGICRKAETKYSLEKFDRSVFEALVDHVIVGGYDEKGIEEPYKLTFVYKSGHTDSYYQGWRYINGIYNKEPSDSSGGSYNGILYHSNGIKDPDVVCDLLFALDKTYPDRPEFHHAEGNSAAHLKASTIGSSITIIIENGKPLLGTWQGIYFCEFDAPRNRTFYVKVM